MTSAQTWSPLGTTEATDLVDARLQLHWAVQPVSAAGTTHLPAEDDWSHTTLAWAADVQALAGRPLPAIGGARIGLRVADLTLVAIETDGSVSSSLALLGRTLNDASSWVMTTIAERSGNEVQALELAPYELPDHAVGGGATFDASEEHLAELAHWYANADLVLQAVAQDDQASAVRIWPHHFDIASLLVLDPELGAEKGRSIGVGMTPGDGGYAEPYIYVTPYPYPQGNDAPELPAGGWHTEGWFGAVLTGSDIVRAGAGDAQQRRLEEFVGAAVDASRKLLG